MSLSGYGSLFLTDASYQYGNSFGERASNFSFWWHWATNDGAFADDPNLIQATVPDVPIGPGGGAKLTAKGLKLLVQNSKGVWKWAVNGRTASLETLKRFGLVKPILNTTKAKPIITKEFVKTTSGVPNNPGPKSFWQKVKEIIAIGGQL